MRPRQEYKITTNLSVFNKLHKYVLEKDGKIKCSRCSYHNGENIDHERYGITVGISNRKKWEKYKYPNWKLVSKSPKQWMKKPIEFTKIETRWGSYTRINW